MAQVLRVKVVKADFEVDLPPPNGDSGYWHYRICVRIENGKPVAEVRHQLTGMRNFKPAGSFPAPKVSEGSMVKLAQEIASRTTVGPANEKGRAKEPKVRATEVRFEVTLDGVDQDGEPRQCEVLIAPGQMTGEERQPDGRIFFKPVAERYTAKVRRKTVAGKAAWVFVPSVGYSAADAGKCAADASGVISWRKTT